MGRDPATLFYIDNWLVSTKEMHANTRGWYLNLILHQYDKGDLPSDIEELANLADVRMSEYETFKQAWEQVLKHKFRQNETGRLENDKAKEILKKREMFVEKRKRSGTIGYIIKFATAHFKLNRATIEYLKSNLDIDNLDIKNEQILKQVLKQTIEVYINRNGNKSINNPEIELLVKDFYKYQESINPKLIKVNDNLIKNSIDTIDKLIRIDGFTIDDIKTVLSFVVKDDFWSKQILSLVSLRNKSKNGNLKFVNAKLSIKKSLSEKNWETLNNWHPDERK
jgi:hypothetical protein